MTLVAEENRSRPDGTLESARTTEKETFRAL